MRLPRTTPGVRVLSGSLTPLQEQADKKADAYVESFQASLQSSRQAMTAGADSLLDEVSELREELVSRFLSVLPLSRDADEKVRDDLIRELDSSLKTFDRLVSQQINRMILEASAAGGSISTAALRAAGVPVTEPFTEGLKEVLADASRSIQAIVKRVRDRVLSRIESVILSGLNGATLRALVQATLDTEPRGRGEEARIRGIPNIVRLAAENLALEAFSASQQEAAEGLSKQVRDLRKTWVTAGDGNERRGHLEAGERYAPGGEVGPIPVGEKFLVRDYSNVGPTTWATLKRSPRIVKQVQQYERRGSVGEAEMLHPRDPESPVSYRVNCRCVAMESVGDFEQALDDAVGRFREEG